MAIDLTRIQEELTRLRDEYRELNTCLTDRKVLDQEVDQHAERLRRCTQNLATAKWLVSDAIRYKARTWAETLCGIFDAEGKAPTKPEFEARIRSDVDYIRTCDELVEVEYLRDKYDGLVTSYQARGHRLRDAVQQELSTLYNNYDIKDSSVFPKRTAYSPTVASASEDDAPRRRSFDGN